MDLRGYGSPIYAGYSACPQPSHGEIDTNPEDTYEYGQRYSISNLSQPDDSSADDMWAGISKKQGPRGSNRDADNTRSKSKTPGVRLRNHNPGIDVALRNLDYEVSTSLKMFEALVQCFEGQVESLRDWAEEYTLDTIWRNKVKDRFREKLDRDRFEGVAARISSSRAAIKDAVKTAKTLKGVWQDKHALERQIRTARKALLHCNGIIDLAERAATERVACKELVFELEEARCLLDRKKHPWIYGEEAIDDQSGNFSKLKGSAKGGAEKSQRDEFGSDGERIGEGADGNKTDRHQELSYSFGSPPDQAQEDAAGNQDGETW